MTIDLLYGVVINLKIMNLNPNILKIYVNDNKNYLEVHNIYYKRYN